MTEQLSLFSSPPDNTPKSVSEVTRYIGQVFDRDAYLQEVWVQGEVSNLKRAASGHLYFSLKDTNAQLKCVMWKSDVARLRFEPQHGDLLIAQGKVGVYAPSGEYQLYARVLQAAGVGDLHRRFELLKAKMEAEGLFDSERKRPLPPFPRKIGIVTSPDAAGFQDMLNILARRYPLAEIILSPTLVQGNTAPPFIVAALAALNRRPDVDVIIMARGGGSLEDLWCFNDERVVRAVASSRLPIITGVGHEIDFTLVDFAADLRAPTPSAAAELVTPDSADLLYTVRDLHQRLKSAMQNRLADYQSELATQKRTLRLVSPLQKVAQLRQQLDDYSSRMLAALRTQQQAKQQQVALLTQRLDAANPQQLLARGYALLTDSNTGARINSIHTAKIGDSLTIQVKDGTLTATVTERTPHA